MSYTLTKRGGGKKQRTLKNKNKRRFKQNGGAMIKININDDNLEVNINFLQELISKLQNTTNVQNNNNLEVNINFLQELISKLQDLTLRKNEMLKNFDGYGDM